MTLSSHYRSKVRCIFTSSQCCAQAQTIMDKNINSLHPMTLQLCKDYTTIYAMRAEDWHNMLDSSITVTIGFRPLI